MAKQLNVDLHVKADTSNAKKQLQDLNKMLSDIQSTPTKLFDDQDLKKASAAAAELQKHLQAATNVDTGKLDLTRFASSLKRSGKELKDYKLDLEQIGSAGTQAFLQVARSIAQAEAPTLRLTQRMNDLIVSLKNTVRWQISSSMLHAFMGTIQSAYRYAQDLNKSLNNIRIVTGQSTDQMAAFAEQANKSAKALSTTTTRYTDAALIFYQQGLDDKDVQERTNAVIKLANVTGESATEVSSYMTAIWNNFNKESDQSAEHFEDVLAALGASTASSTAEIAGGLEKFASIAQTTGLSYDYAASALATLVANTRQSEDVVGTSLKTIFSRIQGLQLGETLEDGVDLNKYSEALQKIGVDVLDATGQLRDLDSILDDMAGKWQNLTDAEKVATAQTVAGVRQYNQLVALMDNWGDMEDNLQTARNADGTIGEQAEIYAQSWEAAQNNVRASLEKLYGDILDDSFFIELTNNFSKAIDVIDGILDGLGGVKGLLFTIGGLITQHFAKELPAAMERIKENAIYLSGFGDKISKKTQADVSSTLATMPTDSDSNSTNIQVEGAQRLSALKEELLQKQNQLSQAEKEAAEAKIQQLESDYQILGVLAQEADKEKEKLSILSEELATQATQAESDRVKSETGSGFDTETFKEQKRLIKETIAELQGYYKALAQIKTQGKVFKEQAAQYKKNKTDINQMKKAVSEYLKELDKTGKIKLSDKQWDRLKKAISETNKDADELINALDEIGNHNGVNGMDSAFYAVDEASGAAAQSVEQLESGLSSAEDRLNSLGIGGGSLVTLEEKINNVANAESNLEARTDGVNRKLGSIGDHVDSASEVLGTMAGTMMSLSAVMASASSTWNTLFNDEDATKMEKISAAIGFITTAIFGYTAALKLAKLGQDLATKSLATKIGVDYAAVGAEGVLAAANATTTASIWAQTLALLCNPLTAAIACAALVAGIAIFAAAQASAAADTERETKALEAQTKAATENANALKENADSNRDALKQMDELLTKYQETGEGKEELDNITQQLCESYDLEGASLAKLTGEYDDYNKVREQVLESQKDELNELLGAEQDATDSLMAKIARNHDNDIDLDGNGAKIEGNNMHLTLDGSEGTGEEAKAIKAITNQGLTDMYAGDVDDFGIEWDSKDPTKFLDIYDKLVAARLEMERTMTADELSRSGVYEDLNEWLDAMEDDAEELRTHLTDLQNLQMQLGQVEGAENLFDDLENVSTYEEYTEWVNNATKALQDLGYSEEDIADTLDMLRENSLNPSISDFEELSQAAQGLHDVYGINKSLAEDFLSGLSDDERTLFWKIDFDTYQTKEAWETQLQYLQAQADQEALQLRVETADTARDELQKDGTLKDETRQALKDQYGDKIDWDEFDNDSVIEQLETINKLSLDEVDNLYSQYEAYQQMLEAQAEAKANDEKRVAELKQNIETLEQSMEGVSGVARTEMQKQLDAWNAELDELANKDYTVDIDLNINDTIYNQFETIIDGIVDKADGLRTAAELIGEGFIVAAEDAETLARVYPELLNDAIVYEDGRVKLDEAAVQAILGGEAALLDQDKEGTRQRLESQITLLDAQITFYETKAKLLQQALDGEISYEDAVAQIQDAEAQFEKEIDDWCTQNNMDNDMQSTNYALDNLDALDKRIQEVSEHYSAMLSGELVTATTSGHVGAGTATGTDTQAPIKDQSGNDVTQQLKDQLASTNEQLETLYQERADLVALEAKLGDSVTNSLDAMNNAATGLGGKTDKDKGGSDKEKSEKELKNLDKEIERYAEIKELLDDIKREHDRLSKAKDRSWGAGRVKAINAEQAALQKQLGTLKQYKSQVQSFLNQDAAKAASFGASIVDGHISNFNDVIAGLTNDYNAAVTAYNGTAAGSEEEKSASKAIEDAEKRLSDAKEAMKQYEQTKDLMEDITDQITDTIFQIADLDLERITYIVELKLDLDDRQLRLIDDILEDLGDSADNALDSIEKMEDAIDTIFQSIIDNKDGVKELLDYVGVSGADSAAFLNGTLSKSGADNIAGILQTMVDDDHPINYDEVVSKLEEYTDNLLDANEKLRQYRDQVFETLTNAMGEYLGDLNRISDKIAHITKLTQGYKDLITSIGKSNLDPTGALTQKINKTLQSEAESAYKSAKATQEYAQTAYNEALEGYQIAVDTGDEYAIRKWKEVLEQAEDDLNDAEEATLESMTALADAIATVFTESISQAVETMNHELGGLSVIREKFDQAKELSAQYLDDYKKIYELSKLNREVNASIDDTDNIRAKQLLMEYQQKIVEYQKDGVEMSQYEVDYLRAQYDLILARIAIEEAQKAKSQVSMVQDSEGNYSYVYTADDQAVADAEQNYEDKLYAMQVLNGEYINELQENLIAMQEEMGQKLEEIAENDALTYEEKKELIAETTEYYLERINFYSDQLGIAFDNNSQLYEKDWQEYHDKTGYKISANEDYIDSWEETSLAIITNVNSQQEYLRILETAIREARDTSREACDAATESLNNVGFTSQVLGNVIDQMTNQLENDARRASMSAEQMSREYQSAVTQIMNSVQAFTSTYCSQITAIIAQNQALIASMNAVIAAAAAMAAAVGAHSGGSSGGGGGYYGSPGSAGSPAKPSGNTPAANQNKGSGLTAAEIEGIAGNIWIYGSWGDNPTRQATMIDKFGQADGMAIYNAVQDKFNSGYGYGGGLEHDWDYYKKFSPSAFATGGYTGDWGSTEGKLALLHEKELVLNQYDTSNMLQMIDMVRKIANTIDINALSSMGANLQAISSNIGNETEKLEQEVHITAEFPGVSDRNEILAAFDNVINLASQYANRK